MSKISNDIIVDDRESSALRRHSEPGVVEAGAEPDVMAKRTRETVRPNGRARNEPNEFRARSKRKLVPGTERTQRVPGTE